MSESFPTLARLSDRSACVVSARELIMFFNELEMRGAYQILASRGENEKGGQVKIFVTYDKKT